MLYKKIITNPLFILAVVALLVVIYIEVSNALVPVVAVGDTIKVNYTGTFTNNTIFDSSSGRQPLQFTVGSGQLIKGFDQGVIGMKLNEEKTIAIPENEAYGEINTSLIVQVPVNTFGNNTITIGTIITRNSSGQRSQGIVTALNSTAITIDFNSPLAGKTLIFKIKVVSIQKK